MVALSVAKLKLFSPESEIFPLNKAKKEKKNFLQKVWIKADVNKKYAKRQEMFSFVISLCLSDHKVLHNIASSSSFLSISLGFSRFFRSYFVLQIFGV